MHSHPRSSPGLASLLTLLPAQVVVIALTSAGTHGTIAGAQAVSHLPAMESKDTRSGPVRVPGKSSHSPSNKHDTNMASSLCPAQGLQPKPRLSFLSKS